MKWERIGSDIEVGDPDEVTVATPFNGKEYSLQSYLEALDNLDYDKSKVHLLWLDVSGRSEFHRKLKLELDRRREFASVSLVSFGSSTAPNAIDPIFREIERAKPNYTIARLKDMAAMWEKVKTLFSGWRLFILEDDVVVPPDGLKRLMSLVNGGAGDIASGVLPAYPNMIPFVWRFETTEMIDTKEPLYKSSVVTSTATKVPPEGVMRIGAAAMGCTLFKAEPLLHCEFRPAYRRHIGSDVTFGLQAAELGFKWVVDCGLRFGHVAPDGEVYYVE